MAWTYSSDRPAFARELTRIGPEAVSYGQNMLDLVEQVKAAVEAADAALRPADKVRCLEAAKLGLDALAKYDRAFSTVELCGLESARAAVARREATYRAFGYYRMAGRA